MRIHLPNSAFIGNVDPYLMQFDPSDSKTLHITTHDSWMSLHPVVLAMVAALGQGLDSKNITFDTVTARSGHYLERMGLFKMLGQHPRFTISEHEPSGRFVPLTQINNAKELKDLLVDIIPMLHLDPKRAGAIHYVVSELVRNVLEHADSPAGAIFAAQYYPKSNVIRLGIVDNGLGIRRTIVHFHQAPDDLEAIKLALMPGVTGTTWRETGTDYNAGAGLFFIKSIASVSRNYFMVYSGNALYKLLKRRPTKRTLRLHADPNKDKHSQRDNLPYFQGTAVGIDISLESTEEFDALLEFIRTSYVPAIRERQKARYKKARFI